MTKEELALAEQLLLVGSAKKKCKILGGKAEIELASLTTGDQLDVESEMRTVEGTPAFMVHTYSLKLVSQVLKSVTYNGAAIEFTTVADAHQYLLSRPSSLVDAVINEHTKFEKELAAIARMDTLVENFTEAPPVDSAQS